MQSRMSRLGWLGDISMKVMIYNGWDDIPIPLPVMSKAEPWMGSNMDGFCLVGSRLLVGAMPIEPAKAAARSDRISACCLVVSTAFPQ